MVFLRFEPNGQTYLSLINGYVTAEKYFSVLLLWTEVRKRISIDNEKGLKLDYNFVDTFLYALVKVSVNDGGHRECLETTKERNVSKPRKKTSRRFEALLSFLNISLK
ncbi:Pentatricopeptide repeat-containing protein [Thalictrum thalictroides]|uniref:Pentatricopeptide repeat-containing protein n=1 Tax=Thalictrum thalictroides TaxID=46969 RepID=A0A7J6VS05_THATH|nr:Pentatricopeptide repeat-containing protein [Thalictrum thalictroides]